MIPIAAAVAVAVTGWHLLHCQACPRLGRYPDSRGVRWCAHHHPDFHGELPDPAMLSRLHFQHLRHQD